MDWKRFTAEPALADFVALQRGSTRLLVRRGYEDEVGELGLGAESLPATAVVSGGRQAHPLLTLAGGERVVVRRFHRGGLMRHLNRDRYFLGHRAFHELLATERARAAGVRVPVAIAAAERRGWLGYGAALATRWIAGATELVEWLRAHGEAHRLEVLRAAGREIARLHDSGVGHPDLNLRNLLVGESGADGAEVHLLDLDRAGLYPGPVPQARRARDLRRLARSARKLRMPLGAPGWKALREGYGADWPLDSAPE